MSAPGGSASPVAPVVGSKAVHCDRLEGRLRASAVKVGNSVGYHYDILSQGLPPVHFLKPVGICIPPNSRGLSAPTRPPPQRTIVVDRNKERIGSSFSFILRSSSTCFTRLPHRGGGGPQRPSGHPDPDEHRRRPLPSPGQRSGEIRSSS